MSEQQIGTITNYYGGLAVKQEGERCFWSIENWNGNRWEEIPKSLYNALVRFEKARKQKQAAMGRTRTIGMKG